jgi:ubiquinone/menaquinone biosynthesis C-methylase UbiE
MAKQRIPETDKGIQGEFNANAYDQMMRRSRDRGELQVQHLLQKGMTQGIALEIGPGPGYIGLEWLKRTSNTVLKGLDISPEIIKIAERNAAEYGLSDRVEYRQGNGGDMPFDDNAFDVVFTYDSLHEWSQPEETVNEIYRVLKPGARYLISDLRRDIFIVVKWFLWLNTQPKKIRSGLTASINAAYLEHEIRALLERTRLCDSVIEKNTFGMVIYGSKRSVRA